MLAFRLAARQRLFAVIDAPLTLHQEIGNILIGAFVAVGRQNPRTQSMWRMRLHSEAVPGRLVHLSTRREVSMSELAASKLAKELIRKTDRADLTVEALIQSFLENLLFVQGRSPQRATRNDLYMALSHSVRERLVQRWISTVQNYHEQDVRIVCYFSAEYLTGPHLANNLINLGIYEQPRRPWSGLALT